MVTHPGIAIWGTLEARVQSADLVILGGLNEGIWPRLPAADPWLGRGIRRAVGLPSPERRIGLSAHDFQQAMGARRVVLTRATRDAEAPTVASRWLLRLENLLLGLGPEGEAALGAAKARGARLARRRGPARPAGRAGAAGPPPVAAPAGRRPGRPSSRSPRSSGWSATPTASTPRKVLRLRRLDPPGRQPDALTRGKVIHAALDDFVTATEAGLPAGRRAAVPRHRRGGAGGGSALAGGQGDLDRRGSPAPPAGSSTARPTAAPAAHRPPARSRAGARSRAWPGPSRSPPAPTASTASPAATRSTTTSPAPTRRAAEARAFHLQLPLEAAIAAAGGFEGLRARPRRCISSCSKFGRHRRDPGPRRRCRGARRPPGRASPR